MTDRTLLFVGQNEANVSLAAAPDSPGKDGQPRFPARPVLLTGRRSRSFAPVYSWDLRARDIGQAGVGRHDRPRPQGCPALEFCLFEDRGERSGSIIIQRPLWGFESSPQKRYRLPHLEALGQRVGLAGCSFCYCWCCWASKDLLARCIDEAGSFRDC